MTCRDFAELVFGYVEGRLDGEALARFDEHLGECPDCVRYLQQYRDAVRAGRVAFDDERSDDVPEDLVRAILAARHDRP